MSLLNSKTERHPHRRARIARVASELKSFDWTQSRDARATPLNPFEKVRMLDSGVPEFNHRRHESLRHAAVFAAQQIAKRGARFMMRAANFRSQRFLRLLDCL